MKGLKEGSNVVNKVLDKIQEFKDEDLKVKEEDGVETERDNTKEMSSLGERVIEKKFENSEAGNYLTKEALDETLKTVQSMFCEGVIKNEV